MRFLVDAQLPPGLARWLTEGGHYAEHVADVGLASASDIETWNYALACGAVILTKDEDFTARLGSGETPQVVWIRLGNTTNAVLIRAFEPALPAMEHALTGGEKLIEVR